MNIDIDFPLSIAHFICYNLSNEPTVARLRRANMSEQITTLNTASKRPYDTAFSAVPLGSSHLSKGTNAARAIDVLSFLFLLVFQCGAVVAILLYTPQIGQMGLVVFGIVFVWLGATLIVGVCDLWAQPTAPTGGHHE